MASKTRQQKVNITVTKRPKVNPNGYMAKRNNQIKAIKYA